MEKFENSDRKENVFPNYEGYLTVEEEEIPDLVKDSRDEFSRLVPREYWDLIQDVNFCIQEEENFNKHLDPEKWSLKIRHLIKGRDFIDLGCGRNVDTTLALSRMSEARRFIGIDYHRSYSIRYVAESREKDKADIEDRIIREARAQRNKSEQEYEIQTGEDIYTDNNGIVRGKEGNRYASFCKVAGTIIPGVYKEIRDLSIKDDMLAGLSKMKKEGTSKMPYMGRFFHMSGIDGQEFEYFNSLWNEIDRLTENGDSLIIAPAYNSQFDDTELKKRGFILNKEYSNNTYFIYTKQEK